MENLMESNIIEDAKEQIGLDLKQMIEDTKDVVSVYVVDRKSAKMIIRKVGYAGFTVVYNYSKSTGKWSVCGYDTTPDRINVYIENWGNQLVGDEAFYEASHAYSWQEHGFYSEQQGIKLENV